MSAKERCPRCGATEPVIQGGNCPVCSPNAFKREATKLPQAAIDDWVEYDPPEFRNESSKLRHAFMSGWLARDTAPSREEEEFPRLEIRLGGQIFNTTFGNINDLLKDNVWNAATTTLHEVIKKHFA